MRLIYAVGAVLFMVAVVVLTAPRKAYPPVSEHYAASRRLVFPTPDAELFV